ncbi:polyprenyl synthetase family protein [Nocardia sp. NBC_01327]|uniref:polyprenyl synthetase family protein n=1 Tax=Nocardia sp. NBC_01327 TaxID=2903593 RepID=UPI002E101CA0|nr:polyprenyl synthetase family protein [Nocardia sp. NBC_01327]
MTSSAAADPAFDTGTPWEGGDGAAQILTRAHQLTKPLLRAAVDTLPAELRLPIGYHLGWWNAAGVAAVAESGKGLRPALVLASARAAGKRGDSEWSTGAVHAAAAIELVHNFTLIHDDVMDGDEMRRGRPTVWRVWGIDDAVLAGDAMHGLAIWTLAGAPVAALTGIARLEEAVIELCLGQHSDCAAETKPEVTLDECLETLQHKTGALLGCACAMGALCAGARPEEVEAMDRFGRELGVAFQLVDDLMGIWGDPARTGKPVGNDLLRHKRSLPVVVALESGTAAGREFAELYCSDEPLDGQSAVRAADLIARAGGRRWAQAESIRHVRAAKSRISGYGGRAKDLMQLADCVVERDH